MVLFSLVLAASLGSLPPMPVSDARNISLSENVVRGVGDEVWPNWSATPFAIDLITATGPIEVNFKKPIPAPSFPPSFEATFPWPNGVPTIVIGEPRFTHARTPIRWSVTLIHEHFHQWQFSWPQYESATKHLGLAPKNAKNAMWMLDYPFPYKARAVDDAYQHMAMTLAKAVETRSDSPAFPDAVRAYISARMAFRAKVTSNDFKYFTFQCWQEGTARYTEIKTARDAVSKHALDPGFITSTESAELKKDADATEAGVLRRLRTPDSLRIDGRLNFYAIGAGEALLLDQIKPGWRKSYLNPRMDLGVYFADAQPVRGK